METLSKNLAADPTREKDLRPPPSHSEALADSMSMSSYRGCPAHCPFVSTLHHIPQTCIQCSHCPVSPSKAFPETKSAAILSALRNLQEKIRRLELDKSETALGLHVEENDASHRVLPSEQVSQRLLNGQTDTTSRGNSQSHNNQALITHLAAAESRCAKLERQLEHMRRILRGDRIQGTSLQSQEFTKISDADKQSHAVSDQARMEKLEKLEEEYLKLRCAQKNAEVHQTKILELEGKVQEEEHQRKIMQDKARLLQKGMEANRILLQSAAPSKWSKGKMLNSEKPTPRQVTHPEPHYRLNLRDVPFVAGTSAGSSHSVRANVQAVLSLLKQHQPHLCNSCVLLSNSNSSRTGLQKRSDCSSSSCASEEELSELQKALQDELRLMSVEQDKLMWQLENSVSEEKRKELLKEQERLLLKMERKGEQIHKLHKYKSQVKKSQKAYSWRKSGKEGAFSSRGCSTATIKIPPGEGSKKNLRLLRDMKVLQASLQT